jgi:DnaJ-class molecular chaperone
MSNDEIEPNLNKGRPFALAAARDIAIREGRECKRCKGTGIVELPEGLAAQCKSCDASGIAR